MLLHCFPGLRTHDQVRQGQRRRLIVSLGKKEKLDSVVLRNAAAAIGRRAIAIKAGSLAIEFSGRATSKKFDAAVAGQAFGEGLGILGWVCDQFAARPPSSPVAPPSPSPAATPTSATRRRGLALAEGVNIARTLSQTPPNVATPYYMAEQAQRLPARLASCKVFKEGDLERDASRASSTSARPARTSPA